MHEEIHPYKLQQDGQFNLESIPVYGTEERIEFFYKYKRPTENLYTGYIDKTNLLLKDSKSLLDSITAYFVKKQFHTPREVIVKNFNNRLFPKVCWLTDSFFKVGFKHLVSVHYNPRIQQNVMHPGSTRNHVIKLFQESMPVNCMYYNTGGVEFEFMKSLEIFDKAALLKFKDDMKIELVADHCSIIPHINLDIDTVRPNVQKWQEFIYRRLISPTFTVTSNKNIRILAPWYKPPGEAQIEITIGDITDRHPEWNDIVCKCAILSVLGRSYKSELLTVNHKLSFATPE
jgi:hypothetical protein